jgi:hypothetical protein
MDPLQTLAQSFNRAELQEEYDKLMAEIQILGQRAGRLQRLIGLLDEIEGPEGDPGRSDPEQDLKTRIDALREARPSLTDAILLVMGEMTPDTIWTADKILIELERHGWAPGGKTPRNSVDATLSRLNKLKLVQRRAPGTYTLPSETSDGSHAATAGAATLLDEVEVG